MDEERETTKHAGGRPTKYRPIYCKKLIEFFSSPPVTVKKRQIVTKSGVRIEDVEVPNDLPTIEGFARKMGIAIQTVYNWERTQPEFMEAVIEARALRKNFLIQNGLKGFYQPNVWQFITQNLTDMRTQQKVEVDGVVTINLVNYANADAEE